MQQTLNRSQDDQIRVLAMTDFGLSCSLLGHDDRDTRLTFSGKEAYP